MHERLSPAEATCGFPGLLKGTQLLGCALITDRGFCRDLAAKYAKAGILSPREWCEANNVLFLWPFTDDDDVGLVYDPTTHRLNIVPKDEAKVRVNMSFHMRTPPFLSVLLVLTVTLTPVVQGPAPNWSRYVTYLRAAVEQFHAALWRIWPGLQRRLHSHMNAVGRHKIDKYFNW